MSNNRILPLFGGGGLNPQDVYTKEEVNALIADFITNTVDDLVYYYDKTETYTQQEIQNLIGQITSFEVVATLPTEDIKTNVIYLLGPIGTGADRYEEYIYSNSQWVKIGETSVDLSNYITVSQLNTALGFYTTTFDLNLLLQNKQDVLTAGAGITISSNVISADSNVISMTQAEYDALGTSVDPSMIYIITDAQAVTLATVATSGSYNDLTGTPTLATVATSGSYNDLTDKPSIPVVPTLATVATTGAYNDLTGKPNLAYVATSGSYYSLTDWPVIIDSPPLGNGVNVNAMTPNFDIQSAEYYGGFGINSTQDDAASADVLYVGTDGEAYLQHWDLDPYGGSPVIGTKRHVITDDMLSTVATTGSYNDLTDRLTAGTGITIGTDNTISAAGGYTEEIEHAIAAAINDTRDSINQDLHNNYVKTQTMNDALKPYATKASLDSFYSKSQVDTTIGSVYAEIEDKERAVSYALNDLEANKQDKLTAGGGITIGTDNTISAIGTDTVALTFTLANLSTVTYNVVIN